MRFLFVVATMVFGLQPLFPGSGASAQSGASGPPRSGWYVGAALGLNRVSDIDQNGWNRDSFCYPTDACFDLDPRPEIPGYRWRYNNEAAAGYAFQISIGRVFSRKRVEFSLAQRANGLDQVFQSVTNFDGVRMEDRPDGTVASNDRASIDRFIARTVSMDVYYDFPLGSAGLSAYLGGGLGAAQAVMSGVHYSNDHKETASNAQAYDPPLSFYNSRQDGNPSDVVVAGSAHAGVDFAVNERAMLGLKLTYSMTGGMDVRSEYSAHPMQSLDPDFSGHNSFDGARFWTLALSARRFFSN